MFEITARTLSELKVRLGPLAEKLPSECKTQFESNDPVSDRRHGPFVQLAYDEIRKEEIDRLLGYAEISSSNAPIGLEGDFPPVRIGTDPRSQILIFSLSRLEEHLLRQEPDLVQLIRELGSMDAFVAYRGEAMTACEYLTGGLLGCMEFCRKHKQGLAIQW
jgi:hypothetical protein